VQTLCSKTACRSCLCWRTEGCNCQTKPLTEILPMSATMRGARDPGHISKLKRGSVPIQTTAPEHTLVKLTKIVTHGTTMFLHYSSTH